MTTSLPPLNRTVVLALAAALFSVACGGEKPEALLASARDYMAKNDNKAAVIQIKNALQKYPELAEGRFLLGKALLESGDPVAAEVELRKAQELNHPVDQVAPLLMRSRLALGQVGKVVEEVPKIAVTSVDAIADLQTSLASAYAMQGNRELALKAVETALWARADFAPAILIQARFKAGEGDIPAALKLVDSVVQKSPREYEGWKLKGDLLNAQKERELALAAYGKAVEVRPDFLAAHAALVSTSIQMNKLEDAAKALDVMKKIAAGHPQTLFLATQLAFINKDFKAARESSQQLVRISPNNPAGLQQAGAIEFQMKSLVQAETYLNKSLQLAPDVFSTRRWLTLTYLAQGQTAKAVATLAPILGKIEQDAAMLALAGDAYMRNNDVQKAEEFFAKAAKLDPKDAGKRTSLALTRFIKGDADGAFTDLEQISASDTGTTADMALIATHLRRGEFDKALKSIDTLEKKQPDNPVPHNLRGRVRLAQRDLDGARKSFERALALTPSYYPAAESLASLDLSQNKPDDARKRFEAVLAADPKNTQAMLALVEVKARTGGTSEEILALINKAVAASPSESAPRVALVSQYLRSKDPKKALGAAQDALAAMPERPELLDALGRAQQAGEDFNQALTTYGKLSAIMPSSPQPYLRMAEINAAAKSPDAAAQSLRKALALKADLIEAQRALVLLEMQAGKPKNALVLAREVQKQRPKEAIGYMMEGDIAAAQKLWSDAVTAYRAGLKLAPVAELAIKLHSVLVAGGGAADADKFANGWLKEQPKDAGFRFYLGDRASARKDYAVAVGHYKVLLETQPDNPVLLNNIAWVTGQQKAPDAIEFAEKANKLSPNQPAFMDTLAMLLAEKGDTARALELLAKAVELAPQAASVRLNLAKVLLKAGKKADAKKHLDELAKLGDKFQAQAEVAQLLKET